MVRLGLSTSSLHPLPIAEAFRLGALAGFDGVEVMVTGDPRTRDATGIRALSREHGLPVLSVHAPVLAGSQTTWGLSPAGKLERAALLALELGAATVVAHPPYRWQRRWSRAFEPEVARIASRHGVQIAVENMFALRLAGRRVEAHRAVDPTALDCAAYTLDVSHAAADGRDALELALAMGERLRHLHLCDGGGRPGRDAHLVPGRGTQPVAALLRMLAERDWGGVLVAEVATRHAADGAERLALLGETVRFTRAALASGRRRDATQGTPAR
ncbi:MAG: sugar phosphate isomerase/epimerase [Microbacteriaceae bacterium]